MKFNYLSALLIGIVTIGGCDNDSAQSTQDGSDGFIARTLAIVSIGETQTAEPESIEDVQETNPENAEPIPVEF